MDQIKTGQFIAGERKRKGYTQKQLAETLNISDKTISKWERGGGFPEVSLGARLPRRLPEESGGKYDEPCKRSPRKP